MLLELPCFNIDRAQGLAIRTTNPKSIAIKRYPACAGEGLCYLTNCKMVSFVFTLFPFFGSFIEGSGATFVVLNRKPKFFSVERYSEYLLWYAGWDLGHLS